MSIADIILKKEEIILSKLIDDMIKFYENKVEVNGCYYIAKPYPFFGVMCFKNRLKNALRVLKGRSQAYHYKEDELA